MSSTFSVEVGARLREVRRKTGKNQSDFGREFGVSRNSQVDYEAGKSPFNIEYLGRLQAAGVDVGYIVTGRFVADSLTDAESAVITKLRSLAPGWLDVVNALLDQALHPFGPSGQATAAPTQGNDHAAGEQHTIHDHQPGYRAAG